MEATLSKPQSSSTTTTTPSVSVTTSTTTSSSQEEDLLARLAKLSDGIQTSQHNVQSLSSADEGSGGKPMNLQDIKHVKAECDNKKDQQPAAIQATAPAENSLIVSPDWSPELEQSKIGIGRNYAVVQVVLVIVEEVTYARCLRHSSDNTTFSPIYQNSRGKICAWYRTQTLE